MPSISLEKYSLKEHKVVCFVGKQIKNYNLEQTVHVKTESDDVKVAVITA